MEPVGALWTLLIILLVIVLIVFVARRM